MLHLLVDVALACAPAPPEGVHVHVTDEQALIVFDPASRTEHFIRRATFQTDATAPIDLGFLVPTPTVPTLAEAPAALFERLADTTRPQTLREMRYFVQPTTTWSWMLAGTADSARQEKSEVEVLAMQRVGAYEAAILRADEPRALHGWLKDHGFPAGEHLAEWLKVATERKHVITAFKLAKDASGTDVTLPGVRLSFNVGNPWYPYREPAPFEASPEGRRLQVWLIAPGSWYATIGASTPWQAEMTYSAPLEDLGILGGAAPVPDLPWLTAFTDAASPRPAADDLWFRASPREPVRPEPKRVAYPSAVPLPLDVFAFGAIGGLGLWWRRKSQGMGAG